MTACRLRLGGVQSIYFRPYTCIGRKMLCFICHTLLMLKCYRSWVNFSSINVNYIYCISNGYILFTLRPLIAIRMRIRKKKDKDVQLCISLLLGLTGHWQQLRRSHLYKVTLVINWLSAFDSCCEAFSSCVQKYCFLYKLMLSQLVLSFVGSATTWNWLTWSWSGWQTISKSYFITPLISATIVQSSSSWQEQRWGAWVRLLVVPRAWWAFASRLLL